MKKILLGVVMISVIMLCYAQKPVVDTMAANHWAHATDGKLSGDGKYFVYGDNDPGQKVIVKLTNSLVKIAELPRLSPGSFNFTADKALAVFIQSKNGLVFFDLDNQSEKYIKGVTDYKLSPDKKFLLYSDANKGLHIRNLLKRTEKTYPNIADYQFIGNGGTMLLQKQLPDSLRQLCWLNLATGKQNMVWQGPSPGNIIFYHDKKLAFTSEGKDHITTVYIYDPKTMQTAKPVFDNRSAGIPNQVTFGDLKQFSRDGTRLFFDMSTHDTQAPQKDIAKVDVWSYTDQTLQHEQSKQPENNSHNFLFVADIQTRQIRQIQQEGENINLVESDDDYAALDKWDGKIDVSYSIEWLSTHTGDSIKKIDYFGSGLCESPDRHYLLYFDQGRHYLYSYNILTGNTINLTKSLPVPIVDTSYNGQNCGPKSGEWHLAYQGVKFKGDNRIILHDKYDIWLIDPSGKIKPFNLTNGYGRKNDITFEIAQTGVLNIKTKLLLKAFNNATKDAGFFSRDLKKQSDPERLSMGPFFYEEVNIAQQDDPLSDGKSYLVTRESAATSLNYFVTKDFKNFRQLTDVCPERNYNWLTSELINFPSSSGYPLQAAVYKPENFDPRKKYPVIITYYEKLSQEVNHFKLPGLSSDRINIPWYVSRGYIVVTPDIQYTTGHAGESALAAVAGAANYLKKLSYVNADKIAITGHSYGAIETDYIVAHTHIFAAAFAFSGFADMISQYGSIGIGSKFTLGQMFDDDGQCRVGATLWARPDLYIENSPILQADNITTPLLLINNHDDPIIPFAQGVEFFTALRRLGKKVWMLQYDGEGHSVSGHQAMVDFNIRLQQFFDHYLKDMPAPIWMTHGIPAYEKGTTDGLGYDPKLTDPPPSPLITPGKDPKIIYNFNN